MKLGAHSSLTQQAIDERPNICAYFVDNSTYSVSGVVLFSHVRPSGHGVRLRASAALVACYTKEEPCSACWHPALRGGLSRLGVAPGWLAVSNGTT